MRSDKIRTIHYLLSVLDRQIKFVCWITLCSFGDMSANTKFSAVSIKIKQSLYRPGQALRIPGDWGSQISKRSPHEGGKFVSPTLQPPLIPQIIFLVPISVKGWVDPRTIVRLEEFEPSRYRLEAQWLNKLRHRVPLQCIALVLFLGFRYSSYTPLFTMHFFQLLALALCFLFYILSILRTVSLLMSTQPQFCFL